MSIIGVMFSSSVCSSSLLRSIRMVVHLCLDGLWRFVPGPDRRRLPGP
ncbi:unnamed protein product, partial [marine sediment metagenome]